ncbi:MAG: type 1 glutamine amidotransferase [Burkholderiales bacterium]
MNNLTKSIAIIQFKADDAPAFFTDYLSAQNVSYEVFCMHKDDAVPKSIDTFSGLCVLGGSMSANDPLPYMPQVYALIADALRHDIPIIGHCLGGQMLAKALGAEVKNLPQPVIGWSEIMPLRNAEALRWFGHDPSLRFFHWHYESFSLPAGATHLASTPLCPNQTFSMGKHIGMQFHCEVTHEKIDGWLNPVAEIEVRALSTLPTVQQFDMMRQETEKWMSHSQKVAGHIYTEWLRGVGTP